MSAKATRQRRPLLEEFNREIRHFWIAMPGGVKLVGLKTRTLQETGNWLVLTNCFNAFNAVIRTRVLPPVVTACQRPRRL